MHIKRIGIVRACDILRAENYLPEQTVEQLCREVEQMLDRGDASILHEATNPWHYHLITTLGQHYIVEVDE